MPTPRIAVVGSCATRDVWHLAGPPGSRPVLHIDRTSLASMTLAAGVANPLAALAPEPRRRWHWAELAKDVMAPITACQPTAVLFDFIDDRFDLLACGEVLVNESLELLQSGLLASPPFARARRLARLEEEAWRHWLAGLRRWQQAWQAAELGNCSILLHACQWAAEMETVHGRQPIPDQCEILPGRVTSRAAHNALLRRMQACFAEAFPQAIILTPPEALRVADAAHRWGPAPFHFIAPYYRALAEQAAAAGIPLWDSA